MTPEQEQACANVDGWCEPDPKIGRVIRSAAEAEAREVARVLRQALAKAQATIELASAGVHEMNIALHEAMAERDAALRRIEALENPTEERLEDIAELFDSFFLPAWRACREKHGRDIVHPAFASWGPAFLRALAALDKEPTITTPLADKM